MATQRKSGRSRSPSRAAKKRTARPSPKRAHAKAVASRARVSKSRPRPGKPIAARGAKPASKAAVKAAVRPTSKAAVRPTTSKAAVRPASKVAVKPAAASKVGAKPAAARPSTSKAPKPATRPAGKRIIKVVTAKPTAPVRPIGVLPPEAIARATQRPGPVVVRTPPPRPRPAPQTPAIQGAQGVSEKDYKEFEQRLLAERQRILKEMGHLENTVLKVNQRESAGDLSGYSFHMADVGTDAMEREKAFLFASAEGRLLREITEALRKIYHGEYGICESCNQSIVRARLEAMPYVRLCIPCQEKKEKEERAGRGAQ